jgi:predicted dehydrogenase
MNSASSGEHQPRTSRRDFIRRSSWFVAGGAVGTGLGSARPTRVFGSDAIRVGLIGCGRRGTNAAMQALGTTGGPVHLVAMADTYGDRLQGAYRALKSRHVAGVDVPTERRFVGADAFRRLLDCSVDVVLLATPPVFRPLHFTASVASGKHVFMEKPVAVDVPGVRLVLEASEAARRQGLAVSVGLQRRHDPAYQEIIAQLQSGAIGEIRLARAYWNSMPQGVPERRAGQSELDYQLRNWQHFDWLSGRPVVEQHIHNLDVINWLKQSHPVSAQGQGGRASGMTGGGSEASDQHFVEYTYPDGTKLISQCRRAAGCWNNVSEHAHGTRGRADISGGKIYDSDGAIVWQTRESRSGHELQQHSLFAALRGGELPNDGEASAISTLTSILGRMAAESGQWVTWDEMLNSSAQLARVRADGVAEPS